MIPGIEIRKKPAKIDDDFKLPNLMKEPPLLHRQPVKKHRAISLYIVCAVGMYFGVMAAAYQLNMFFDHNRLEFRPIVEVQQPVKIVPRPTVAPVPSPTPEPTAIPTVDLMAQFVWYRETGYGKAPRGYHMRCREQGKWNELGYKVSSSFCFESKEQGFETIEAQFSEWVKKSSVVDALCTYNLGWLRDNEGNRVAYTTCGYYDDFVRYIEVVSKYTKVGTL